MKPTLLRLPFLLLALVAVLGLTAGNQITITDDILPVIILTPNTLIYNIEQFDTFTKPTPSCTDNNVNISSSIIETGNYPGNTDTPGNYNLIYDVSDAAGLQATIVQVYINIEEINVQEEGIGTIHLAVP